uniref:RING-type E3 ubiquitin transferase n=1 Tax=Kalanchoe fedtschenkoi TaxID=63787 RepID=A0A7N0U7F4_KALFE
MRFGRSSASEAGEAGPSAPSPHPVEQRGFPLAAQPEIMRAAEKDEQYASYVYEACRDAFRHLFGARVAIYYQSETKLLGQMLYYVLTTGSGQQTLGEEYCDITQVAGPYGLPPTPARRALFIVYQSAVPYIAERISSRVASHSLNLADEQSEDDGLSSSQVRSSALSRSSVPRERISIISRWRQKFHEYWLLTVQRWPMMLPVAREALQLIFRTNLMFFYFEGLYYHISKRASGIRYVFIGKPLHQRPRYQILGVFLLVQLCILAVEGLRRNNFSNIAASVQQMSSGAPQTSTGRGLPILNEEGSLLTRDSSQGNWVSDSPSTSEVCSFKCGIPYAYAFFVVTNHQFMIGLIYLRICGI